ncbi:hypothetical protein [Legionella maioricensis]|uniref:Uncharacterized protein n=1 Tax=Legionella maioricensis TaxID=2896528 RepID=A0A9X2D391_9GAMM|nr:hypothetical protein [Legionella maioricensis]MCL9685529.1 hypothetical protein [Legionella maioricensis]MCL9688857.1 hypothetical protein [Legionella maioricensis]
MTQNYTPINIETLILVAVWESPFVFQGSFKIIDKSRHTERFIFYRCECNKSEKTDLLEDEFSPYDYQLTHLYRVASDQTQLEFMGQLIDDALYLLKYALYVSLTEMIRNNKQYLTYIDEVALLAISKRVGAVLKEGVDIQEDKDLGFAVSMDFNPSEALGQAAVSALIV